jgi:L-amino acid N-acyltransferase YncA
MSADTNAVVPGSSTAPKVLELEPATWDDMDAVVEIIRSSASWYEDIVEPEDFSEHLVDRDWARENFERRDFYVARLGDEVIGTVTLQDVREDHVYLGYVYLHEEHVGNGYGGDLLDFARSETRGRGRSSMVLIAHPEAVWACKAYERYGFEVIARDRDEILAWEDGWMEPYYEEGFELYGYRV